MSRALEIELAADLDLKRLDRLERVAEFKNKLGLALVDYVVATKQTRLIGSRSSQLLR